MKELLFFVLGLLVGGLTMTTFMCCLQINRVNKMEALYKELEDSKMEVPDEN